MSVWGFSGIGRFFALAFIGASAITFACTESVVTWSDAELATFPVSTLEGWNDWFREGGGGHWRARRTLLAGGPDAAMLATLGFALREGRLEAPSFPTFVWNHRRMIEGTTLPSLGMACLQTGDTVFVPFGSVLPENCVPLPGVMLASRVREGVLQHFTIFFRESELSDAERRQRFSTLYEGLAQGAPVEPTSLLRVLGASFGVADIHRGVLHEFRRDHGIGPPQLRAALEEIRVAGEVMGVVYEAFHRRDLAMNLAVVRLPLARQREIIARYRGRGTVGEHLSGVSAPEITAPPEYLDLIGAVRHLVASGLERLIRERVTVLSQ